MKRIFAYVIVMAVCMAAAPALADAPQVTLKPVTELPSTVAETANQAPTEEPIESEFALDESDEVMEFTTYAETPEETSHRNALNIARYEPMLRELVRDAFYVGDGWDSVSDISDMWSAVYSYLNRTGIDANSAWVQPDGTAVIPGVEMNAIFKQMYGADEVPSVSSPYSARIIYDQTSDSYTVARMDIDNVFVLLTGYALNSDSTATLSFSMIQQYSLEEQTVQANLGSVTLHLNPAADSEYGFAPDMLVYYPEG